MKYRLDAWIELETEVNLPQITFRGSLEEVVELLTKAMPERLLDNIEVALDNAKAEVVLSAVRQSTPDPY
jgi:hypothetical protein